MTRFKGFSPAARLYAENFELIAEMQNTFREDVVDFLMTLEIAIQKVVAPERFRSCEMASRNRYWWLGDRARTEAPYLWFTNEPSELDATRLLLVGGTDSLDEAHLAALLALPANAALGLEQNLGMSRYNAFNATLRFEGEHFVEDAARRIGAILLAMNPTCPRRREAGEVSACPVPPRPPATDRTPNPRRWGRGASPRSRRSAK